MGNLVGIARWFMSPPSEEEALQLYKVASALKEVANVGGQLLERSALPAAVGMGGVSGLSEYRKSKALFNPQVQKARNNFGAQ